MRRVNSYNKYDYPGQIYYRLSLGLLVILHIVCAVYFEVEFIHLGNDIAVMEVEITKLQQENRILEIEITNVTSLRGLREKAKELGYAEPRRDQIMELK